MSNAWYELQKYEGDEFGWVNWRNDGLAYNSVEDALEDFDSDKLDKGYRIVEIKVVLKTE